MTEASFGIFTLDGLLLALARQLHPAPPSAPGLSPAIDALKGRDPAAWEEFFRQEMPAIYRYALSRLGRPEEAEELSADVFAEAWAHIGRLVDEGLPARAWLFGIARNLVAMRRRFLFRQPPMFALESVTAEGRAEVPGELLDLGRAMQDLSPSQAEVINLRFIQGLSLAETAAVTGMSVDAVKGRQARALLELRRRLNMK